MCFVGKKCCFGFDTKDFIDCLGMQAESTFPMNLKKK